MTAVYVAVFGMLGVLVRFGADKVLSRVFVAPFPVSILLINCIGSFWAGLLFQQSLMRERMSEDLKIGLAVGFLGGLTTFSSYSLDSFRLLQQGQWLTGLGYLALSPLLGFVSVALGFFAGKLL